MITGAMVALTNGLASWGYMLLAAAGIAVGTVATRGSFFVLPSSVELPEWFDRLLRFAPACALAAVIAPAIVRHHGGSVQLNFRNEALWGVVAATAVFLRWRNMLAMMSVGLLVAAAVRAVVG